MIAEYIDYFNGAEEEFQEYNLSLNTGSRQFSWTYLCMAEEDDKDNEKELILDFTSGAIEILKLPSIPINVKKKLIKVLENIDFSIFKNELKDLELKDLKTKISLIIKTLQNKKVSHNTMWFFYYCEFTQKVKKILEKKDENLSGNELLIKVEKIFSSVSDSFEKLIMKLSTLEYIYEHKKLVDIEKVSSILKEASEASIEVIDDYMQIEEKEDYFKRIMKLKSNYNIL